MKKILLGCLVIAGAALAANPFAPSARGFSLPESGPDDYRVSFWDGRMADPMLGADWLEPALQVEEYPGDGTGWYLVQLAGPVYSDQVAQLERTGAQFLGFHSRYLAFVKADHAAIDVVQALGFVRWAGVYQPGYKFWSVALAENGFGRVAVTLFLPENIDRAVADLEQLGCSIVRTGATDVMKVVEVDCSRELLPAIARLPYVMAIEEWHAPETENQNAQWVIQDWAQDQRRVWKMGLFGQDEILGYSDEQIDPNHYAFRDQAVAITDTGEFPTHRKIAVLKKYPPARLGSAGSHGTHVGGTIAGNDSANGGASLHDGHSKEARLVNLSPIPDPPGDDFTVPLNMITNDLRNPELRPRTISNSWWTGTMGQYTNAAATFDQFSWKNKDIQTIKSCGNQGQSGTKRITEPGNSKSIISCGALENGTSATQLSSFSSRGPASDNRVKPDVCAPGNSIYSAQSGSTNGYVSMGGTSMAAPCVNGSVGLLRSYLRKGYYPSGAANPADTWGYVSSAILKGMVLVSADPNIGSYVVPSEYIGWGRIDLDSVLFFVDSVPDARKLLLDDDTTGLATGQYVEYQFRVVDPMPLRCAVVWTDTAAAAGANPCLINNLNCLLTAPTAKFYKGCLYTSGQSTENPGGAYDNLNPNEMFRVNVPDTGLWTLRVEAQNVVTASQPFAVVVTGGISYEVPQRKDAAVTAIVAPVGQVDSGTVVIPQAVVANRGTDQESLDVWLTIGTVYADTQFVTLAPGASDTVDFLDWPADELGTFVVRCSTALAGDENPANDIAVDTCDVVPLSGVGEGGRAPVRFALGNAVPTPFSTRTGIRFALPAAGRANLSVFNAAGELVATLANGELAAGYHVRFWDGRDVAGRTVSRGIYYCRLSAAGSRAITKLVKLD